ncbi:hypothetical protein KSP35_21130 [Aquihabitans sp. G128]|uniref:hypothetical protein n=1 Tax=Aquihabitans sp. G128 TaxID=2849779 RepID=UPI001C246AAB|nr:hypothetical protein [Aquihabitans sp. G128]QXC60796.1 hypothetical protein KSP35_21130 [Aquihabitans sp. G128]
MKNPLKRVALATLTIGAVFALGAAGATFAADGGNDRPPPVGAAPPSARAVKQLFSATDESTYTPITPCRIVDTRVNGGRIQNNQTRTYYVGGTFGFAPQGGKSGGCGVPVGATAITANVTAADPDAQGYLRAFPNGAVEPNATTLSYEATDTAGTGASLAINQGSAYALRMANHGGPTHLIIDVTGYYQISMAGLINSSSDGVYAGSRGIVNSVHQSTGTYLVTFNRDVHYCTAQATTYNEKGYAITDTYQTSNNQVQVQSYNSSGVLTNNYIYVTVTC